MTMLKNGSPNSGGHRAKEQTLGDPSCRRAGGARKRTATGDVGEKKKKANDEEYNFVSLAMPFKITLTCLQDADDTEKERFSSLKAATLVTTSLKAAPIQGSRR